MKSKCCNAEIYEAEAIGRMMCSKCGHWCEVIDDTPPTDGKIVVVNTPITKHTRREKLAAYAHRAWSGWMKYMFDKSTAVEGEVIIPESLVKRWTRQMNTPYDDLPEEEKNSDRIEADRIISIFRY